MVKGKAPAFQWYPGDFLRDPRVAGLTFCSRAVWREVLDAMFLDGDTGDLSGTIEQLALICRCTVDNFETFISENKVLKAADVTVCDGIVTLVCRRMKRKSDEREAERERVRIAMAEKRKREKALLESDADVTKCYDPSSSSSSSSSSKTSPEACAREGEPEPEKTVNPTVQESLNRMVDSFGLGPSALADAQDETAAERRRLS